MYENEERLTEEEVVDSLRALVKGEEINCTMLGAASPAPSGTAVT